MAETLLRVEGLTRRFGGLVAVDRVSLEIAAGQVHALIGPNGAGKTTLINLLSGDLSPSAGRVWLDGRDITGLAPHRIARQGIGRSYQRVNIFPELSVFENCRLAAQARLRGALPLWRTAHSAVSINDRTAAALARVGLDRSTDRLARTLSHGEQRQLEIAMTLAIEPKLLLLDEPLAGMGAEESADMVGLIANLAATHGVLLVEHDMNAVFSVADRLTVMVNGRILESGAPAAIRASAVVQEAYLGDGREP
jgi:branched-chain amino acid transport system ATP-binding protein